jgi:hypothetical protein
VRFALQEHEDIDSLTDALRERCAALEEVVLREG